MSDVTIGSAIPTSRVPVSLPVAARPSLEATPDVAADGFSRQQVTQVALQGRASLEQAGATASSASAPEVAADGPADVAPSPALQGRQFADSYGRVTHLALMLSGYVGGTARKQVLAAYRTLFQGMEPDTRFTIVVGSSRDRSDVEKVIREAKVPNPDRIRFVEPGTEDLTVWARDMMITEFPPDDPQHTEVVKQTPLHNWHDSDSQVPAYIAGANPSILEIERPELVTDGGDVMSNTKQAFVGYYSIAATAEKLQKIARDPAVRTRLFAEYEAQTGKKVVDQGVEHPFSFSFEPVRVAPGDHRFPFRLVQDPAYRAPRLGSNEVSEGQAFEDMAVGLFEKALGKPVCVMGKDDPSTSHVEEPATDHLDMGCTPVDDKTFFVGDPRLTGQLLASLSPTERKALEERFSTEAGHAVRVDEAFNRNRDNVEDFDAYEKHLREQGYNVVRVPHAEPGTFNAYVSYNNCLMERFEKDGKEVRRVFLPSYGIEKLDKCAADAYRSQGFEVIPMPLDALSQRWGALRCISNWLERSPRG